MTVIRMITMMRMRIVPDATMKIKMTCSVKKGVALGVGEGDVIPPILVGLALGVGEGDEVPPVLAGLGESELSDDDMDNGVDDIEGEDGWTSIDVVGCDEVDGGTLDTPSPPIEGTLVLCGAVMVGIEVDDTVLLLLIVDTLVI